MSDPIVSVIIPTYNTKSEWLHQAIESALAQTYSNIEVIVIDDCSTVPFSGIANVLDDERICWLQNDQNYGVSATRNHGATVARGEYLAFLDADDWWAEDKLRLQVESLEVNSTAWCYTTTVLCNPGGSALNIVNANYTGNIYEELLKSQVVAGSCSGVMVRRRVFNKSGMFDDQGDIVEDWDMWLRLARNYPISCVDVPLVFLRTFGESRSSSFKPKLERLKKFQRKYYAEYIHHGLVLYSKAHYFYVVSRQYFVSGRYFSAISYLSLSFACNPFYYSIGKFKVLKKKILTFLHLSCKSR